VAEVFSDPPINYLDGIVEESVVRLGQDIRFPLNGHMRGLAPGGYRFGIRCNHLFLNAAGLNDTPIQANVELCEINGSETFIHIRVKHEGTRLVVQNDGVHQFKIGSDIKVFANPGNMFVYNVKGRLVAAPSGSPQS
jgi:glycerol transport system ATP-binding protein